MAEGGARLLVVDDNKVNRLLLGRTLQLDGHQVSSAENGREALESLRRGPCDLMLLDMEMPELDGFGVLEALRSDPELRDLRDLPVIVTSSLEGVQHVARCIDLGADDFLHKPVNPVLLKARVGSSLEKKRLRDQRRELLRRFATREVEAELELSGFALGGRRLVASVLFIDIRGFTSLAETLPPEEVIDLLNGYYALMFEVIGAHGGVVNQIIGDGLMAIFGAPQALDDAAGCAVRAARDMLAAVGRFNDGQGSRNRPLIRVGIGVATGEVVAGYTGTLERATYTCIGDAVNLASRLETHTKEAGCAILVDAATRAALPAAESVRSLGPVPLRGKAQPVEIFAPAH